MGSCPLLPKACLTRSFSHRTSLLEVAGVSNPEWSAVLLQGSGTYAVEAVIQTSSPREGGRVLILANGAYGRRMARICEVAGIPCDLRLSPETRPVGEDEVRGYLTAGVAYTLVAIVHCERLRLHQDGGRDSDLLVGSGRGVKSRVERSFAPGERHICSGGSDSDFESKRGRESSHLGKWCLR